MEKLKPRVFDDPGFTLATLRGAGVKFNGVSREEAPTESCRACPESQASSPKENPMGATEGSSICEPARPRSVQEEAVAESVGQVMVEIADELEIDEPPKEPTIEPACLAVEVIAIESEDDGPKTNLHVAIESLGATYFDKRSSGGCLWILADGAGRRARTMLVSCGMRFQLASEGGKVTGGSPAWWTKDPDPEQFFSL